MVGIKASDAENLLARVMRLGKSCEVIIVNAMFVQCFFGREGGYLKDQWRVATGIFVCHPNRNRICWSLVGQPGLKAPHLTPSRRSEFRQQPIYP